jgi:hypothetical protein
MSTDRAYTAHYIYSAIDAYATDQGAAINREVREMYQTFEWHAQDKLRFMVSGMQDAFSASQPTWRVLSSQLEYAVLGTLVRWRLAGREMNATAFIEVSRIVASEVAVIYRDRIRREEAANVQQARKPISDHSL